MVLKVFAAVGAAVSAALAPQALADAYHPFVPPKEDMLARVDGLAAVDPSSYQDCVGQSCHVVFKAVVDHDSYLCDMYSAAQTAECVQIDGEKYREGVLFEDQFLRAGGDEGATGGQVAEGPGPERVADAAVLPDRSRISFSGGEQVECWVDGPLVGCRSPQQHGFAMYHNGGAGW